MKYLIFLFTPFFISIHVFSQSFEGVISWKLQADVNNSSDMPKDSNQDLAKAKEELLKQLKSPDVANNPQLKEMLENMLAQMPNSDALGNGNLINSMMPKGMTIKIKSGNSLVMLDGGMAQNLLGDFLTIKDKPQTFIINKSKKTYSVIPNVNSDSTDNETYTVTKTNEKLKILGLMDKK